jgi:GNAT superfamily N-acetyltransferase
MSGSNRYGPVTTRHPGGVTGERDLLRRADSFESAAVADLWLRSRKDSVPANPPGIHDDDDVRNHFATVVLPEQEVWVLERGGAIVALMSLSAGWVMHLHVEPGLTGRGLGSRLLEHAKRRQPAGLDLWTFQSNTGARRFYERHGFVAIAMTDGDNEERAPDVRYHWPAPAPA